MGRLYDLAVWHALRGKQLNDEPLCRHCKARGLIEPALDVDHITPISKGGAPLDQSNLQSLCHECHSRKTVAENGGTVAMGCSIDGIPIDPAHAWNRSTDGVAGVAKSIGRAAGHRLVTIDDKKRLNS